MVEPADVVGPICESGDFLALDRGLPAVARGELLCVFSAGAYGFSMSSNYNTRPRAAEVLVDGAGARVVRRRVTEFFDERTRRMLKLRNVVTLEAVHCVPPRDGLRR